MKEQNIFDPFTLKGLEVKNRIMMSPMCQYSVDKKDGIATDWHYIHYVSRAIGGAGLVMVEMTDVEPDGRISNYDLGLWSEEQVPALQRIVDGIHQYGAKAAIQIAHAGRKAEDAEVPVAPSAIPFDENSKTPRELTTDEVYELIEKFRRSVRLAVKAGFDAIEIHGAHGYLIHQFHSPLTNKRTDEFGQDLTKFGSEILKAAKEEIPDDMPLIMRISAKEYVDGGYNIQDAIELAKAYHQAGAEIFDITSGGEGQIPAMNRPGTHAAYQVPLAREIKKALNVPVIAVGRLDNPILANAVVGMEDADLVAVGRGMLRNPYWAMEAAKQLKKSTDELVPKQYEAGF
ncbi:NADH:flavin oxidoreductase/NADH oxidase [Bacillus pumilus]|uniref:NADH:flavin oxidoreductase/NADH oxidase n=1 Tax=Bacillus pumilus TaxID=1408 RepID=UPI001C2226B0|nr:NADH:flavin oxidoreductase/NADH oxidase [Bacillus pumilus]MBU8639682.1 NADH:flavin oxidoreductase/NADH oxidase [Bacillus pumilus]